MPVRRAAGACLAGILPLLASLLAAGGHIARADETVDGRKVYDMACAECHDTGKALAPIIGDGSWAWRAKNGMDKLMIKVRYGAIGMPAKGGCQFCTDDELIAATQYILDNSPVD
jgi:cytochrome c5